MQLPAVSAVNVVPDTAPSPDPVVPVVRVNVAFAAAVTGVVVIDRAAWANAVNVNVTGALVRESKLWLAAFVAVTVQLPGCVEFKLLTFVTVQPAVPDVTAYVTSPEPDPPDVVKVTGVPAGPENVVFEIVSVA